MNRANILVIFEQSIEADEGSIVEQARLDSIAEWDSLAVLGFLALIDSECGKTLAPKALAECATVNDVVELVVDAE